MKSFKEFITELFNQPVPFRSLRFTGARHSYSDINAAKNIRNFALIARDIGLEQPESKPVETITNGQILDLVKSCL